MFLERSWSISVISRSAMTRSSEWFCRDKSVKRGSESDWEDDVKKTFNSMERARRSADRTTFSYGRASE